MKKDSRIKNPGLMLFLMLIIPLTGYCQPDIPLETELKSNSESWHVKVKQSGAWGSRPALVSFGPLKTISTNAGKYAENNKTVDRELFWKNIQTVQSRETVMTLLLNSSDTVQLRMLTVQEESTRKKNTVGTLTNADLDGNEMYRATTWIDEMIIRYPSDSSAWRFIKTNTGKSYGVLENIRDTTDQILLYTVNNMDGKKTKEVMFSQPATGFVFVYKEKQVAAFQTLLKENAWLSRSLDPKISRAVMATIAALMATIKTGNQNGF